MTAQDTQELADRFENAVRAHERLGKVTRDDEKTRALRKDCIAAVAEARRAFNDTLKAALAVDQSGRSSAEPVAFDPLKGGCPHCRWLDTNLGRVLDQKCKLHQEIEDMQADVAFERQNNNTLRGMMRALYHILGAEEDDDIEQIAKERMEELRDAENAAAAHAENALSPPVGQQEAVAVKPLVWADGEFASYCPTIIGNYIVRKRLSDGLWTIDDDRVAEYDTREEAQAAAQADFEQRILSALSPSSTDLGGEVERLRAEIERLRGCLRDRPNTVLIAYEDGDHERLARAAAKAIDAREAAESRLATAVAALEPFAQVAILDIDPPDHRVVKAKHINGLFFGHFRRAREALASLSNAVPVRSSTESDR